jgi:hypothetical protein
MGLHMIERAFARGRTGTTTPDTPKSPIPKKRKPNAINAASVYNQDMYDSDGDLIDLGISGRRRGDKADVKGTGYAGAMHEDVSSEAAVGIFAFPPLDCYDLLTSSADRSIGC